MMIEIQYTETFSRWMNGIKDKTVRLRLLRRLRRVTNGHLGDVKPVGGGIFEMREHFGAGYRMYYIRRGNVMIVMLGGGDKSSQETDIVRARETAHTLED